MAVEKASEKPDARNDCGHDLGQVGHERAVVGAEHEREKQLHRQQPPERGRVHQPEHGRIGADQHQRADRDKHGPAADAVGHRPHHRQPDEVGDADRGGDGEDRQRRQVQHLRAERGGVDGDHVEGDCGQRRHQDADRDASPVAGQAGEDLAPGRVQRALGERAGLRQRAAQEEQHRHDQAADAERNTPAPGATSAGEQAGRSAMPIAADSTTATCWLPDCQAV